MGEDTVDGIRKMFAVCIPVTHFILFLTTTVQSLEGKIALSLDAWTSSNQYAFLAIVAHYITNKGELEELLIDFRELSGEHTGENMAQAVWETLTEYDLIGRVSLAVHSFGAFVFIYSRLPRLSWTTHQIMTH